MTSFFSSISGQFGKGLILGTFFPTVLFVLLNGVLLAPFVPDDWPPLRAVQSLDPEWQTLAVSGLTVLFAGLLHNLNTPLVRFYEGYPWKDSWLGAALAERERARFRYARTRWAGLRVLVDEIRRDAPGDPRLGRIDDLRTRLGQRVTGEYPSAEGSVLPTRLGNVIRSFEDYPRRQYGISAITLWPRLAAVVDKEYAAAIEESKTSFDFMVNVSALSAASALLLLFLGLAAPRSLPGHGAAWMGQVASLGVAAYLFYRASIGQAKAWGATVRGAFDLYRGELLRRLGFEQRPAGLVEERRLWTAISLQMIYGDPPAHIDAPLRYTDRGTFVRAKPAGVEVSLSRGAGVEDDRGAVTLLRVRNLDRQRAATGVTVTDTLPEGRTYVWGSAHGESGDIPVSGTNPYRFEVGELAPGEERFLTYRSVAITPK